MNYFYQGKCLPKYIFSIASIFRLNKYVPHTNNSPPPRGGAPQFENLWYITQNRGITSLNSTNHLIFATETSSDFDEIRLLRVNVYVVHSAAKVQTAHGCVSWFLLQTAYTPHVLQFISLLAPRSPGARRPCNGCKRRLHLQIK
jgi:hypothetical protein